MHIQIHKVAFSGGEIDVEETFLFLTFRCLLLGV